MPLKFDDSAAELKRIEQALNALGPKAALVAERFFLKNFELEGFQGDNGLEAWPKRKPDFRPGRKLLLKNGDLRRGLLGSFNSGKIRVEVTGPATRYADVQNFGAQIVVTEQMKKFFWAQYYKTQQVYWKNMALKKVGSTVNIPARKFIGDSNMLLQQLLDFFETNIGRI